jgi:hypothetical protein
MEVVIGEHEQACGSAADVCLPPVAQIGAVSGGCATGTSARVADPFAVIELNAG